VGSLMRTVRPFSLLAALLVFPQLPANLSAQSSQQLGKILGTVRIVRAQAPSPPVLVTLEMRESPIASAYTDGSGRFGFFNLVPNEYKISISDDAYEPISMTTKVDPATAPMSFLDVQLTFRPGAKKDPLPGRVEGSNPYLTDPAEYARKFPKKTLKEFDKGVEDDRGGKPEDAIRHYEKALSYSPDFYPAHNNLGSAFLAHQNFDAAQTHFEAALKVNQNDAQAHFNLGNVFLLTQHYDGALFEIEEGLKRQPNSAFGHFLRASLHSHSNRPELAERELQVALQFDPKMSQAYLQLVNLYLQQKRTPDAIAELDTYLKAFPDSPSSAKARDLRNRLQGEITTAPK